MLVLAAFAALPARAEPKTATSAQQDAAKITPKRLPELPTLSPIKLPPPKAEELAELDAMLGRTTSGLQSERETALRELLEAPEDWVPAIAHRIGALADRVDKQRLKRLLEKHRTDARSALMKARTPGAQGSETPDYLGIVTSHADPKSEAWRDLTHLLVLSRLLKTIGTVEATRALIEIYVRFGEFMRVDTQRQLTELGDRAVAGLIEASAHPAKKIRTWALRQLDLLGKAIPGEVVQTEDVRALADVLRAYGRVRNPDSARLLVSFARSERSEVRLAARQGVALLGETAHWQLREAYQDTVGTPPPRDWTWQRTARELFFEFDRARQMAVERDFQEGETAREREDFATMRAAYDRVLSRNPHFDEREALASGYYRFADRFASDLDTEKRAAALDAAQRATRLTALPALRAEAQSLALSLEADRLLTQGVADPTLLERAIELNPANEHARRILGRIEHPGDLTHDVGNRYRASLAIGLVALLATVVIAWRRRRGDSPAAPRAADEA